MRRKLSTYERGDDASAIDVMLDDEWSSHRHLNKSYLKTFQELPDEWQLKGMRMERLSVPGGICLGDH